MSILRNIQPLLRAVAVEGWLLVALALVLVLVLLVLLVVLVPV